MRRFVTEQVYLHPPVMNIACMDVVGIHWSLQTSILAFQCIMSPFYCENHPDQFTNIEEDQQ